MDLIPLIFFDDVRARAEIFFLSVMHAFMFTFTKIYYCYSIKLCMKNDFYLYGAYIRKLCLLKKKYEEIKKLKDCFL